MIPSDIASALDRYEPQIGRLVAKLELMQSRGQWNDDLTNSLCNFLESLVSTNAFTTKELDNYIVDLKEFVNSVKEATK